MSLIFVCGALLCGLVGLFSSIRAANKVRSLRPITAIGLEAARPGEEVLVEGRVSDRNPVRSHGFVAHVREQRDIDEDGDADSWSLSARMTPPLLLELADGLVQIGNDDYQLEDAHAIEEEESFDQPSTTRYRGLAVDDPIIAVGVVVDGPELPQIEADFIARGTRAGYVARKRTGGVIFCASSIVVAAIGGLILFWDQVTRLLPWRR
jgi:hypothetical protein